MLTQGDPSPCGGIRLLIPTPMIRTMWSRR